MNWRDHSRLTGKHALLGASNYHWLNYDADRLTNAVLNYQAKERGTRLHAFAAECIDLICNGCARQGTSECPEDIRCFYTLDKPFYRPKA